MNGLLSVGLAIAATASSGVAQDAPGVSLNQPITPCTATPDAGPPSARKGKADLTDLSGPRTAPADKVDVRDMSPPRTAPTATARAATGDGSRPPCPQPKR